MTRTEEGPQGPDGGCEPSNIVLLGGFGHREFKPNPFCLQAGEHRLTEARWTEDGARRRPQPRQLPVVTGIIAALAEALAEIEPAERPELLGWVASRGLLGLAHETGFAEAAGVAYRLADTLARGVFHG